MDTSDYILTGCLLLFVIVFFVGGVLFFEALMLMYVWNTFLVNSITWIVGDISLYAAFLSICLLNLIFRTSVSTNSKD